MSNRKPPRRREQIPLMERRDGKAVLCKFAVQFAYYHKDVTPDTITEWDLWDFQSRIQPPRCERCWDTGHVGAGVAAPMTGMPCSCSTATSQAELGAEAANLRERVRKLESLLADKALS